MKAQTFFAAILLLGVGLTAPRANAQQETYKIDPAHSFVIFKIRHLGAGYVWGRFDDFSGTVALDPADPSKSAVDFEVKSDSVDTHVEKRDQHLRSPDFFNAKQFPTITFKSTKVAKADDKTYEVTGDFTLLGVTKPLVTRLMVLGSGKDMQGQTRTGGEATFHLKRSDFGMNTMQGPVGDDVDIILSVEGVKQP